jgi:hypothetical protein
VSETLCEYNAPVRDAQGRLFRARACGAPLDATVWEGWVEFDPLAGGDTIRSRRETTQPNRTDAEYWATGLSEVYLEGSLKRALEGATHVPVASVRPPSFAGPAPAIVAVPGKEPTARSVLDPYSVYEKGEPLLRKQLAALSSWHLVNIIVDYELSDTAIETLNVTPAPVLIDVIVRSVRQTATAR